MKPTIEEVKEYFKNAKEVMCLSRNSIRQISKNIVEEINFDLNCYWIRTEESGGSIMLWRNEKYAEIISYKEETLPIKKTTLLQLAENNSFSESIIKKEFPQLFESGLEVGKWYKYNNTDTLVYLEDLVKNKGYGFYNGKFESSHEKWAFYLDKEWKPATEQEVFEALTNEAVKRGFKEGVTIKNHQGTFILNELDLVMSDGKYNDGIWTLQGKGLWLFMNGTWSEIIDQPKEITISEIEKILGYKILIKE